MLSVVLITRLRLVCAYDRDVAKQSIVDSRRYKALKAQNGCLNNRI